MKKISLMIVAAICAVNAWAFSPNSKVLKAFNERFSKAQQVKWEDDEDRYYVSFVMSGVRSRVFYNKDGEIVRAIRYYQPENLPVGIQNRLLKEYPDYKQFGVVELTEGDTVNYIVKLYDDKHWLTVKVDEFGNSEVTEKLIKG